MDLRNYSPGYWKESTPEIFSNAESEGFANYLQTKRLNIQYLYDILNLEMTILKVVIYGGIKIIQFQYDPRPVINALMQRRLPTSQEHCQNIEIEVRPDNVKAFF